MACHPIEIAQSIFSKTRLILNQEIEISIQERQPRLNVISRNTPPSFLVKPPAQSTGQRLPSVRAFEANSFPRMGSDDEHFLVEWERQKSAELDEMDENDATIVQRMRSEAEDALGDYYGTLRHGQAKRAACNHAADDAKMADLRGQAGNPWQDVAKFIDFQRQDGHKRDVSRMKGLLLRLPHE
jgi:hypothetical protein